MNNKNMMPDFSEYILPQDQRYSIAGLNKIMFISHKQTLSLVLGSCVSTVIIGRSAGKNILAANHIVIADPEKNSVVASKNAKTQIETIVEIYRKHYGIEVSDLLCLHLVGGGTKNTSGVFDIHIRNTEISKSILKELDIPVVFQDTGSFFNATYSIFENNISVFTENTTDGIHFSFVMNLDLLYEAAAQKRIKKTASAVAPANPEFEFLAESGVITLITGERKRLAIIPDESKAF